MQYLFLCSPSDSGRAKLLRTEISGAFFLLVHLSYLLLSVNWCWFLEVWWLFWRIFLTNFYDKFLRIFWWFFLDDFFVTNFFTNFLTNFLTRIIFNKIFEEFLDKFWLFGRFLLPYNLLTIANFRILSSPCFPKNANHFSKC